MTKIRTPQQEQEFQMLLLRRTSAAVTKSENARVNAANAQATTQRLNSQVQQLTTTINSQAATIASLAQRLKVLEAILLREEGE